MSNSNTAQESLEIMKESEKKVVEESVNKTKYVSRSPSKEEVEKDGGEEVNVRQESQVSVGRESWALTCWSPSLPKGSRACGPFSTTPCRLLPSSLAESVLARVIEIFPQPGSGITEIFPEGHSCSVPRFWCQGCHLPLTPFFDLRMS